MKSFTYCMNLKGFRHTAIASLKRSRYRFIIWLGIVMKKVNLTFNVGTSFFCSILQLIANNRVLLTNCIKSSTALKNVVDGNDLEAGKNSFARQVRSGERRPPQNIVISFLKYSAALYLLHFSKHSRPKNSLHFSLLLFFHVNTSFCGALSG